jgi:hypothetical protein
MITKMILIVVVEPLLLLALVLGVLKSRSGPRAALGILAVVSVVALFLEFPRLAAQAAVTLAGIALFRLVRARSRLVAKLVFRPVFTIYAIFLVSVTALELQDLSFAKDLVKRISTLREQYPLVSVADRLVYETRHGDKIEFRSGRPQLNSVVEQRLAAREQRITEPEPYNSRRQILTDLHTQTNDEFVNASGFGRRRISDPGAKRHAEKLELPELAPVAVQSQSDLPYDSEPEPASPTDENDVAARNLPANDDLLSMHSSGIDDFFDSERIGFIKDRAHVAGFQSHRFTKVPEIPAKTGPHQAWRISRLELISLLKHDSPAAYVSENLPEMDKLRDAPTRLLEEFERTSLDRLKSEEDVVIAETPDRIRMVGSLRASRNCLDCHSVRRGELLGALTYELVPVGPTRRRVQGSPPSS